MLGAIGGSRVPGQFPIPGTAGLGHLRHPEWQSAPLASREEFARSGSGRKFPLLALEARWSQHSVTAPPPCGSAESSGLLPLLRSGSPGGHGAISDPGRAGKAGGEATPNSGLGPVTAAPQLPVELLRIWERFHPLKPHSRGCV